MSASDNTYTLRPFSEADRAAVLALAERFTSFSLPPWHDPQRILEASVRLLEALNPQEPDSAVLVAEADGGVLGFVEVRLEQALFGGPAEAYLASLAVVPEAEGRGLGRALIGAAETWARMRGLKVLSLHVFASNQRARALYARMGFEEDSLKLVRMLD